MIDWHETRDWIASFVLMSIGVFVKLVFGEKKPTKIQVFALWLFCGGVVWLTNRYVSSGVLRGGIQLCSGLVAVNLIKGLIKGGEKSEKKISETVEHTTERIADRVDDIADAVIKPKKEKDA